MAENLTDDVFEELLKEYKKKKTLEQLGILPKKKKFASRLIRGLVYGSMLGPIMGILFLGVGMYAQAVNANTLLTPELLGTLGIIAGFGGSVALEISKDMDE